MTIQAPKTEHDAGGGVRQCPIFPELRPYLEAAWDDPAIVGVEFVVNRYRDPAQNPRPTFEKIIKRAGLVPWPKLFQNLRASRETELLAVYPAKDVAAWLGNRVPVAMQHCAMPRAEVFEKAARYGAAGEGGTDSGTTRGRRASPTVDSDSQSSDVSANGERSCVPLLNLGEFSENGLSCPART